MWERVNALRSPAWSTWARASQTSRGLRSRAMSTPDFDALNRYGWSWQEASSVDENYMDLAYLVARNSTCKDGHMGCVVVSGVDPGDGTAHVTGVGRGSVALCTINTPLFGAHRSDCHAEANAVTQCAARGVALRGQSCYVTRSPCLACYKLLASSGIGRIVSPQKLDSADCAASAATLGIECAPSRTRMRAGRTVSRWAAPTRTWTACVRCARNASACAQTANLAARRYEAPEAPPRPRRRPRQQRRRRSLKVKASPREKSETRVYRQYAQIVFASDVVSVLIY